MAAHTHAERLSFATPEAFEAWLAEHHTRETGIWLLLAKKGNTRVLTYAQALDCALCWGWIDGQKAGQDDQTYAQYFCRRRPNSLWSQVNQGHIARLEAEGRLRPPGRAAIDQAKSNGQWDRAYQPASSREVPPELAAALKANPAAQKAFAELGSQARFSLVFRVQSAKKPETRERRAREFVDQLEHGALLPPSKPRSS